MSPRIVFRPYKPPVAPPPRLPAPGLEREVRLTLPPFVRALELPPATTEAEAATASPTAGVQPPHVAAREEPPPEAGEAPHEEPAAGEPSLEPPPVPWEVEAFTTPDYVAPRALHDAGVDDWPVTAEPGDAVPAWDEDVLQPDELADQLDFADALHDEGEAADADFPLDAFIVPDDADVAPPVHAADDAGRVASRLDELARQLRESGFAVLGDTDDADELSRVLAAVVAGYLARK